MATLESAPRHPAPECPSRVRGCSYLDEGASGVVVRRNLVHHTHSAGLHLHYGANNTVEENVRASAAARPSHPATPTLPLVAVRCSHALATVMATWR